MLINRVFFLQCFKFILIRRFKMKKIFILLGCMMSSYVTAVQAQRTPFLEAETFVVVPRNEISGSALEPIELPLGKSNPSKAKSIEPEFQEKEVRVL